MEDNSIYDEKDFRKKEGNIKEEGTNGGGLLAIILFVIVIMTLLVIFTPSEESYCYHREIIDSKDGWTGTFKTQDVKCPN